MNGKDDIDLISEKYRKYLIKIKISDSSYYFIHGADITDDYKDKLLIDSNKKILLFGKLEDLFNYIEQSNYLFDVDNFKKWIKSLREFFGNKYPEHLEYCIYDMNLIRLLFIDFKSNDIFNYGKVYLEEYASFINLVDDYSNQMKNKALSDLLEELNIRLLWDYFYDFHIWKTSEEKKMEFQNKINTEWSEESFRKNFSKIYNTFISSTLVYQNS